MSLLTVYILSCECQTYALSQGVVCSGATVCCLCAGVDWLPCVVLCINLAADEQDQRL